jgi:AmmeMemoRadiSam system radical SAM enzyme/AmmeMemoRadiSam system protein B/AmmeMemoRadiSam system protein A
MSSSSDTLTAPPARWWHTDHESGRIVCDLCPRECRLKPGDRGFCFVRENRDGEMVLSTYGRSTGFCIDPIEKKPLNHFYPGTSVLSFGTAGCNLGCKFCQNWDISKSREIERLSAQATPEAIARACRELGCRSVAFTYNDPVIWAEYAIDTARACRAEGIKTVAVTAGYITPEARGPFYEFMDAANVDLKAFTEDFYWHLTQSHIEPVLDTLRWLKHESDVWFEITNLVIPRANDSPEELQRMCRWVLDNLGDDVPIHFTAFHPDFRLTDRPPTPHETLIEAREIARREGIKFAYIGNVHDRARESTYCPGCGQVLIERDWHQLWAYRLTGNRCSRCHTEIAGRFDDQPGNWGQRRMPVDMSRYARPATPSVVQLMPHVSSTDRLPTPTPVSTPAPASMSNAATSPASTISVLSLSQAQRDAIHRAASAFVASRVMGLRQTPDVGDLAGAAAAPIWGAFVTLKRRGHLRACCGRMGGLPLVEAVRAAAMTSALEDHRLPPISPIELEYLDLDVSLLHNLVPVQAQGAERVKAVVPGRHGLVIQRGPSQGLLLPQVAEEHGWDSETFLRHLSLKAGLASTAWKQADTQLLTFEGVSIAGPLNVDGFALPAAVAPRFTHEELQPLTLHCGKNLLATLSGATPMYILPGGPDGNVFGMLLSLRRSNGEELAAASQVELLRTIPLQNTAFRLVEGVAAALRQQGFGPADLTDCRLSLAVFDDPAMHGALADADLRGLDPRTRMVLVNSPRRAGWAYDPTLTSEGLFAAATTAARARASEPMNVFSLSVTSDLARISGGSGPQPMAGPASRPPAVAGTFYPADPGELDRLISDLLAMRPAAPAACAAVMTPHAGYQFSGRLAAATLGAVQIPDTVIVIGPKHTPQGVDWAVAPHEVWELPGIRLSSDSALARRLAMAIPGLELDAAAHQREHGIEVELPFIAKLNPSAKVVGIAIGGGTLEQCQTFGAQLAEVIRSLPQPPLLVISSDMNHFATDSETRELDALALAKLEQLEAAGLHAVCHEHQISMCGLLPAVIVLETLKHLGRLHTYRSTGYATSADVSGDTSRVVGYAGAVFD